jgi:hypothetical protein
MNTEFSNMKSKNNTSSIIYGCYPDYDRVDLRSTAEVVILTPILHYINV